MEVTIFAGKGGVGKSTCAAAYALDKIQQKPIFLADYDGGHSIPRVLGLKKRDYIPNLPREVKKIPNLHLAVIDKIDYTPIAQKKKEKKRHYMDKYLYQFEEDHGFVAFCDMVTSFFGVPTDVSSVSKFITLCEMYHDDALDNFDNMVIDVEPTAGLERLLDSTESITKSLLNMQNTGIITLVALGAAGWKDINAFLKGSYIALADMYAERIEKFSEAMKTAKYFVICVPESSPVDEMGDVENIIDSYGGEIIGYIINNVRGEEHENKEIARVHAKADAKQVPVTQIRHDRRLCSTDSKERQQALLEVGQKLLSK